MARGEPGWFQAGQRQSRKLARIFCRRRHRWPVACRNALVVARPATKQNLHADFLFARKAPPARYFVGSLTNATLPRLALDASANVSAM